MRARLKRGGDIGVASFAFTGVGEVLAFCMSPNRRFGWSKRRTPHGRRRSERNGTKRFVFWNRRLRRYFGRFRRRPARARPSRQKRRYEHESQVVGRSHAHQDLRNTLDG